MLFRRPFNSQVMALAFVLLLVVFGRAQSFEQTLPAGFLNAPGDSATAFPFKLTSDSLAQWSYDTTNFNASGPVLINEVYVRAHLTGVAPAGNASYSNLEITLIEASTDHASLDSVFENNILRGEVVRKGPYSINFDTLPDNGVVPNWIPLRLQKHFLYDPTTGNDLIIQVRTCGVNVSMNIDLDGAVQSAGTRLISQFNCSAASGSVFNPNFVPITKIDYTPVKEQSLPNGELSGDSNSFTSFPVNSLSSQKWQWHYDASEFAAAGPITIAEVSVRADGNLPVNAFDFPSFKVTLIEASTDYQVGAHDPVFDNNVLRSKVVRSGVWSAPATASGAGGQAPWISFQLTSTFDYDPTTGNDLIVQIESCSPVTSWGVSLDGASGAPGTLGGNRYGNTSSCSANSLTFNNNEFVPVVKIAYAERTITSFPHVETFDHWGAVQGTTRTPPGWVQGASNADNWRFYNRNTSLGTTPADLTTGRRGVGFYMTTDDSYSDGVDAIETPIFNIATLPNPIASFWVYSYSVLPAQVLDENELNVDVIAYLPGGSMQTVYFQIPTVRVLRSGCWTKYAVDLAPFAGNPLALRFRATTDSSDGYYHDFAIDDFMVLSAAPSEGGQGTTTNATLDINDCYNNNGFHVNVQAPGPFYSRGKAAGEFNATITGSAPFQPTALWIGPLNIGVATFGVFGQMDTGTPDVTGDGIPESIFVFGSGLNPNPSFLDLFFFTSAADMTTVSLTLNPSLPLGVLGTFQAAAADGLGGIYLSNAVVFEIVP